MYERDKHGSRSVLQWSMMRVELDLSSILSDRLPRYGHRNWIVVADAAYPSQCGAGIETVVCGGELIDRLGDVLRAIGESGHLKPVVYTDRELGSVAESVAGGVDSFRSSLAKLVVGFECHALLHDQIIARLDEAARQFHVLILKTATKIPYTSVFLNLDCAYWSPEAEERLRQNLADQ